MSRSLSMIAVFAAVAVGTAVVHARIPPEPKALAGGEAFVPSPELAKLVSLGFDSLVSDFHWLRAVQVVGGSVEGPSRQAPLLGRLIDVVTQLDPWVDHPYRFAAVWMTDSRESVLKANRLLARGIEHHPDEWRMRFYKGFNHFFYLEEYAEAADELEQASALPGSPRYLPRLVARLRSHTADIDAAELFLREMLRSTPDEEARDEYQDALDEIEVEKLARVLDRAREAYKNLAGRDIERVEELLIGPHAVLRSLPPAEPSSLPAALRRGSRWVIDPEDGVIQSSYYDRRYELSFHPLDRERREAWKNEGDAEERPEDWRESDDG